MWLKPGYHFFCNGLAGFYTGSAFGRVMGIIINKPNTIFFAYHLVPAVNAFVPLQGFGTVIQINTDKISCGNGGQCIFSIVFTKCMQGECCGVYFKRNGKTLLLKITGS